MQPRKFPPQACATAAPVPWPLACYVLATWLVGQASQTQRCPTGPAPSSKDTASNRRPACQSSDEDEADFDETPDWSELPEEDVLSAFDEDELEDDEPLDGWRAEDDEPSWFD